MAIPASALIRYCGITTHGRSANLHLLWPAHFLILGAVPLLAAILAAIQRRLSPGFRWLRIGLATTLLLDSLCITAIWLHTVSLRFLIIFHLNSAISRCVLSLSHCSPQSGNLRSGLLWRSGWNFDGAADAGPMGALSFWPTIQFFIAHGLVVILLSTLCGRDRPTALGRSPGQCWSEHLCRHCWYIRSDLQDKLHLPARQASECIASGLSWGMALVHCGVRGHCFGLFLLLYLPFANRTE